MKKRASVAIICGPVFAEVCTGKRLNRPVKALLSGCEALGAVNDSIEQEGDYASATGGERKNCFCVKKDFCKPVLSRFACLLPIFRQQTQAEGRESWF